MADELEETPNNWTVVLTAAGSYVGRVLIKEVTE